MTEKYEIEDVGNMFRVLEDNEPLTNKFDSHDKQDVKTLVDELNELFKENSLMFTTIQEHMEAYKEMLEEQEGILFGNAPQERLNALQGLLDAFLLKSVKDSHEGPVGHCRCNPIPHLILRRNNHEDL